MTEKPIDQVCAELAERLGWRTYRDGAGLWFAASVQRGTAAWSITQHRERFAFLVMEALQGEPDAYSDRFSEYALNAAAAYDGFLPRAALYGWLPWLTPEMICRAALKALGPTPEEQLIEAHDLVEKVRGNA